jgi:hypothetical protein
MPARGIDPLTAGTDLGQIDHRCHLPIGAQTPDCPSHQARFAGRARRQHIGESLRCNGSEQVFVGAAPDITGAIGRNRPADDEKILGDFCWQRGNLQHGIELMSLILRIDRWLPESS